MANLSARRAMRLLALAAVAAMVPACGNDGDAGAPGPQGPPGSADAGSRTGDAGTDPTVNIVGTTDNAASEEALERK